MNFQFIIEMSIAVSLGIILKDLAYAIIEKIGDNLNKEKEA